MNDIRHNCGIALAHTLRDAYSIINSLQHRGREAAGIAAIGYGKIDVIKWAGSVDKFDLVDLHKILPPTKYHSYIAHVRYATKGRKDKILEDAHPHTIGGSKELRGDHIIIRNCDAVIVHNGQVNKELLDKYSGLTTTDCDSEALLRYYKEFGEERIINLIPGAYTAIIADVKRRDLIVIRDHKGMRPGILGFKDGKHLVASEDTALTRNGAEIIEDLTPGSIYYLRPEGDYDKRRIIIPRINKHCFFEWNYITDVRTTINGVSVRRVREELGKALAEEKSFIDADFVTFLPRCPEIAAKAYSESTKVPFINAFYKMRGDRSFLGTTKEERKSSIDKNLHLLPEIKDYDLLRGKTVVLVDDSIVRGNNSIRAAKILYEEAGVRKVYFLSYTPKIGIIGSDDKPRGCEWGVDMPPTDNFIARNRTDEEISEALGMETHYLSVQGMMKAFRNAGMKNPELNLCHYCIGGERPY